MGNQFPVQKVKLTAEDKASHIFNHYGMYLVGSAGKVSEEARQVIDDLVFDKLRTKVIHFTFDLAYPVWHPQYKVIPFGTDHFDVNDTDSLDKWILDQWMTFAYGGLELAKAIKEHGAVMALNFSNIEAHHLAEETVERMYADASPEELELIMGSAASAVMVVKDIHQIADDYLATYVERAVKVTDRMVKHFDFPVKYVNIIDEPNIHGITPPQMCQLVRLLRSTLDAYGYLNILVNGPATAGINMSYAESMKKIDPEAFDIMQNLTIHGFGSGYMDLEHRESARNLGKNLWITSTGAPGGIKYSELPRDENGCVYDDWSFGGLINASSAMVDINLGASYIGMWVLVNQARKCFELEYRYHMILADDEEGYPTLGKELLILNTYGYTTTLSATFDNDAEIYYCESSEEGSMSERYDLTNYIKNQMAAVVGKNTDGTWGIAILNKTDSETRKRQAAALKENMKPHGLVSPSVTLEVELDITALHGTGVKTFSVQATGKNGMYLQPREDITLVDGKGTICVDPFEIISIRER